MSIFKGWDSTGNYDFYDATRTFYNLMMRYQSAMNQLKDDSSADVNNSADSTIESTAN